MKWMRAKCARGEGGRARNALAWDLPAMAWRALERVGAMREAAAEPVGPSAMGRYEGV
jgi:hypothetical protein